MPDATPTRRFRQDLECGHHRYLTTTHGNTPQTSDKLLCTDTCFELRQVVATTEVPAMPPHATCPTCQQAGKAHTSDNFDVDHPNITYRCPNQHEWQVQL